MEKPIDYEKLRHEVHWGVAAEELGLAPGGEINIAQLCVDRHVAQGRGAKTALIHENHEGEVRRFTYLDLMRLTNGWAEFLAAQGLKPMDRVCLFLDRVPELYIGFMGILKTGAVVVPLFSAFGEEALIQRMGDCRAAAVITQRRHLGKVRKARERLPDLQDGDRHRPGGGEQGAARRGDRVLDDAARRGPPPRREDLRREPERPSLHERHHRQAQGGPARPLEHPGPVPDDEAGPRPPATTTSTGARPTPAG